MEKISLQALASLSRLQLSQEEEAGLEQELGRIIEYFSAVQNIPLSEDTAGAFPQAALREDVCPGEEREDCSASALLSGKQEENGLLPVPSSR